MGLFERGFVSKYVDAALINGSANILAPIVVSATSSAAPKTEPVLIRRDSMQPSRNKEKFLMNVEKMVC